MSLKGFKSKATKIIYQQTFEPRQWSSVQQRLHLGWIVSLLLQQTDLWTHSSWFILHVLPIFFKFLFSATDFKSFSLSLFVFPVPQSEGNQTRTKINKEMTTKELLCRNIIFIIQILDFKSKAINQKVTLILRCEQLNFNH